MYPNWHVTVRTINEETLSLVRQIITTALANKEVRTEYNPVKTLLKSGIHPMDASKGSTGLGKNIYLIKGNLGSRIVVEYKGDDTINILGIADRGNNRNVNQWRRKMKKLYGVELKYLD